MIQSEDQLEAALVDQLETQGWAPVIIADTAALEANLKTQLEAHNGLSLSAAEFKRILSHLNQGKEFDRAQALRDRYNLRRDDGTEVSVQFLNQHDWCRNRFQVARQISQSGRRDNRYDVTLLINGLPLVHIELKRRGMEIAEAFNQINRYHRDSFSSGHGLFLYVQIFVISNGVNTKYYANQRKQSFMQTIFWAHEDNSRISCLSDFATHFLDKCHIARMICRHIVLHHTDRVLMVLRPYQVYAVEAIVRQVQTSGKNGPFKHGHIWHTTGSGKTLTSFKTAQIIAGMAEVDKVLFVVDRADLDYQTTKEFNNFKQDSVDSSNSTAHLVRHFADANTKLVVTTIQKLRQAISRERHNEVMRQFADKRIIMLFDECHRSQFGTTHQRIISYFPNVQMFGFTGTPIFKENARAGATDSTGAHTALRTTEDLFGKALHKYTITDAISDQSVLAFSVEYWGRLKRNDGSLIDEQVAGIDKKAFFEDDSQIEKICDWIIANHNRKTHDRSFTSIFAVSSIAAACKVYDQMKVLSEAGKHDLRVVTIFTSPANEDDPQADGHLPAEEPDMLEAAPENSAVRDKLDSYIADYNRMFGTAWNTKKQGGFYSYYRDIAKRIRNRDKDGFDEADRIDILVVVSMFLTGFDAKKVNTLYVYKNLRYQGLIQAFSRTNRILNNRKSHGNIVCFRNLKTATDEAIAMYADKDGGGTVLLNPYEDYTAQFNKQVAALLQIVPSVADVDGLKDEAEQLGFIRAFRALMQTMNVLRGFADFKWADLVLSQQQFEDYKSKYLDLYDTVRQQQQTDAPASILKDVDFQLDLIRRDEINLRYILSLLEATPRDDETAKVKTLKTVRTLLDTEPQLRSKRELIEKFIADYWEGMDASADIYELFELFRADEKQTHLEALCAEEELHPDKVDNLVGKVRFSGQYPVGDDVIDTMLYQPSVLYRREKIDRTSQKINDLIEIFEE